MKAIYDSPLPAGWQELPLAKVAIQRRGYTWTKEDEVEQPGPDTVPVIRIPNIQDTLDLEKMLHLRNVPDDAMQKSAVTKDWILFVGSNGTQNRVGDSVLIEEDRPMVFASFLVGMKPRDAEQLDAEFLARWMRIHLVHETFSKTSQQTTGLANYSWGAVKRLPVRFPTDIAEQRRIAAALKLADDALATARTELEATKAVKRSLSTDLLFDVDSVNGKHALKLSSLPHGWQLHRFSRIVSFRQLGTNDVADHGELHTPILKMADLGFGELDLHAIEHVGAQKSAELSAYLLENGDLLFNTRNTPDLVGKSAVWRNELPACIFNNNILRLRFNPEIVLPEYLNLELACWRGRRRNLALATGTTSVAAIYWQDLGRVLIPLPKVDYQKEVVAQIHAVDRAVAAMRSKLDALEAVKLSLLQNLLTGSIRLPQGTLHV